MIYCVPCIAINQNPGRYIMIYVIYLKFREIQPVSVQCALMLLQESQSCTPSSECTALEVDGHEDSSSPAEADQDGGIASCPSWRGLDWLDLANLDELQGHDSMFKSFATEHAGEWNHRKAKSWGGQSTRSGSEIDTAETQLLDTPPMQECAKDFQGGQEVTLESGDLQSGDEGQKPWKAR
jgi:hypothetical protein